MRNAQLASDAYVAIALARADDYQRATDALQAVAGRRDEDYYSALACAEIAYYNYLSAIRDLKTLTEME